MRSARQVGLTIRLLAGAATLRAQIGAPVRPVDRASLEQTLAEAHARVGPRFADLWQAGAALPLEQLLAAIPAAETLGAARLPRSSAVGAGG